MVSGEGTYGAFHRHQCNRKIKVDRGGNGYCAQHDPVAVKAKQEEREKQWRSKWAAKSKEHAKDQQMRNLYPKLLELAKLGKHMIMNIELSYPMEQYRNTYDALRLDEVSP
jgi:hypothetical protein